MSISACAFGLETEEACFLEDSILKGMIDCRFVKRSLLLWLEEKKRKYICKFRACKMKNLSAGAFWFQRFKIRPIPFGLILKEIGS